VVLTAEALARPAPASAATGGNVILGQDNNATATTVIENGVNNSAQAALHGVGLGHTTGLSGMSDRGTGVRGDGAIGVSGNTSGTGPGVDGRALAGQGVYGQSGATASTLVPVLNGVHGITDSPQGYGVVGESVAGGTAVIGIGGDFGVVGSGTGVGVLGSGDEVGVRGDSGGPGGIGVHGDSFTGIGVLATGTTTALSVQGPAVFSFLANRPFRPSGPFTAAPGIATTVCLASGDVQLARSAAALTGGRWRGHRIIDGVDQGDGHRRLSAWAL
jgi:hypothetical protein